jgi:hypothetical protein
MFGVPLGEISLTPDSPGGGVDVEIENMGTMWWFHVKSDIAQEWVDENLGEIPSYMLKPDGFMADWRPARDIANGMEADGLSVNIDQAIPGFHGESKKPVKELAQQHRVSGRATNVADKDGIKSVRYHSTDVVVWDQNTGEVTLNSGGWMTNTTKTRMNQAANEYKLGYQVYSKDYEWFVDLPDGTTLDFEDGMTFNVTKDKELGPEADPDSPYNRESKGTIKFTDGGDTYEGRVQYRCGDYLDVLDTDGFVHVISEADIVADKDDSDDGTDFVDIAMKDGLDAALDAMDGKEG